MEGSCNIVLFNERQGVNTARKLPSNALTSCACKLVELIVNNRLQYYLEKSNVLSDKQHCFRKMRGTEDAHVMLQTSIVNAFALKQQLVAVFFNLKKAYDTTWGYGILQAVQQCTLSTDKTVAVQFCRQRGFIAEPRLELKQTNIPFVAQRKFLGRIYDRKLYGKKHIEDLRRKCTKAMNISKVVAYTHWGSDRLTMLRIYKSLIRSKIDYGLQFYQSAKCNILKLLGPIHNAAIRLCTGAFKSSPIGSLFQMQEKHHSPTDGCY